MAKKHWLLIATVAAGLAVGAPAAMAAPEPTVPGLPALPSAPLGEPNDGDCTTGTGSAEAQSDQAALQLPVNGLDTVNEGNCQSSGNEQGNGVGGGMASPGLPQ